MPQTPLAAESHETGRVAPTVSQVVESLGFGMGQISVLCVSAAAILFIDGAVAAQIHLTTRTLKSELDLSPYQAARMSSYADLGNLFGTLLAGYLASVWGRSPLVKLSLLGITLGCAGTASAEHMTVLLCIRLLLGFSIGLGISPSSVYMSEITPEKFRMMVRGACFMAIVSGALSFECLIAWQTPTLVGVKWRHLLALSACVAGILLCLSCFFLKESPVYLACRGQHLSAKEGFAALAAQNGVRDIVTDYVSLEDSSQPTSPSWAEQLSTLFGADFARLTVCCILMSMCLDLVKFGDKYACAQILPDVSALPAGWQYMIKNGAVVPAVLLGTCIANSLSRRQALIVAFVGSAFCCNCFAYGCSIALPRTLVYEGIFQLGMNGLMIFICTGQLALTQLAMESYPPLISACSFALVHSSGRLGAVLSPPLVEFVWSFGGAQYNCYIFSSLLCILCVIVAMRLPSLEPNRVGEADDNKGFARHSVGGFGYGAPNVQVVTKDATKRPPCTMS